MDTPVTQVQISDIYKITQAQNAELYKTILGQENAHNTIFISIVLAIVVILLGVTWWWNKEGAKRYIRDTVALVTEKQNEEIRKLKTDIKSLVDAALEKSLKKELENYEERILKIEAEVYRTLAIVLRTNKDYAHSFPFLSISLSHLIRLKYDQDIMKFVDSIILLIKDMKAAGENKVHGIDIVKKNIKTIPEILAAKRKEILDFLDTCVNLE